MGRFPVRGFWAIGGFFFGGLFLFFVWLAFRFCFLVGGFWF